LRWIFGGKNSDVGGKTYVVELRPPLALQVDLLGTNGRTVLVTTAPYSCTSSTTVTSSEKPITWTAPADGTYFVQVASPDYGSSFGPYELTVREVP